MPVEDGSVDLDDLERRGWRRAKVLVYRQGARQPAFLDPGRIPSDFAYEEDRLQSEFISLSGRVRDQPELQDAGIGDERCGCFSC